MFFQVEEVQEVYNDVQELLKDIENRFALKIALRSPKSIVAYLGQLIALQNHSADRFVPRILFDDGTSDGIQVAVFRVVRGSKGGERGVLSVRGPDGNDYHVPEPEYGSPGRDQTLRALTIAGELIDAAISEQPLPIPTTAILLP